MSTDQQGGISLIRVEQDRVSEIITLHNEIVSYLRMSVKKAIRIGELLSEQKACLQHGEFLPWIKANLSFTERTAQNYMRLYTQRDLLKNENVSYLAEGYRLFCAPKERDKGRSLYEQQFELAARSLKLECEAGKSMIAMNQLLMPKPAHVIIGTAEGDIIFHIENGNLTVFKLRGEVGEGFTEKSYKTGKDVWWHLDKQVGIGRVQAIWVEAQITLSEEDVRRLDSETWGTDKFWDTLKQIVNRIVGVFNEDAFIEPAQKLYNDLAVLYSDFCETWALITGKA
jgi:hypothetical protein